MNAVGGAAAGSAKQGASSSMNVGASANVKDTIFSIMKEVSKTNKFMHKQDIWTYVQKQTDYATFDRTLQRLVDDGNIYPTYDNDIYSIGPDQ